MGVQEAAFFLKALFPVIRGHVEGVYPQEGCGFLLANAENQAEIFPCRNIQDDLHRENPSLFPRTSRNGFWAHPEDLLKAHRHCRPPFSWRKVFFYHSHPDASAMLSRLDKERLLEKGLPWDPELSQLVISVCRGKAKKGRLYHWNAAQGGYVSFPLPEVFFKKR